jgi:polysaccharide pyruvyl transferase WcaK-like protein
MLYHSRLSADAHRDETYAAYLTHLATFVEWALAHDYDVRLLIGELSDKPVIEEFKRLLKDRTPAYDEGRILYEPVVSVEDLLAQLAETDAVVATRFHNVLLSLVLNKPVISISFHQKCTSLMRDMGLQDYCCDIKRLDAKWLIDTFSQLQKNSETLRGSIGVKVAARRQALDEQYGLIVRDLFARLEPAQTVLESSNRTPIKETRL